MSAFIVEDATINHVVSFINQLSVHASPRRELAAYGADLVTIEGQTELARAMFALNVSAVDQRYPDRKTCTDAPFRAEDFTYRYTWANEIQAYKSLECWLYQCSEGDIPETSLLYNCMNRVRDCMAVELVRRLPAYEAAQWD